MKCTLLCLFSQKNQDEEGQEKEEIQKICTRINYRIIMILCHD